MGYHSMDEVRHANANAGYHWFEPETLRFFRSRVSDALYGGRYFVSSERFDAHSPRRYTVRRANDDGSIDTVGEFQGFRTHQQATARAKHLAAHGE